jgi:DNA-binding PadR family transcriptional regulator
MASQRLLGEVEQMVLLAVARLGEAAYAVSIREEIRRRTRLTLSRGTIYITLDRLEKKGYLRSRFADPTPERGGKAKRYFKLRPTALRALRSSRQALLKMWDGVQPLGERA